MRLVYTYARLTVWIWQRADGEWEAVDWYGTVLATGRLRSDVESAANALASQPHKNIYAVATVTEPQRRRPNRVRPTRRSL